MRNTHRTSLRNLAALTFVALALHLQPAAAQTSGDAALYVTASWATKYARYYAPYALQAAAAYLPVASFDATRGANEQPALNGADVALAVSPYSADISGRATKYLRAWQYQFGSEGYLKCFDPSDAGCQRELGAWTFAIGDGPTFQVWARTRYPHRVNDACTEVSIAFRGTTGSIADWISNASPVTHYLADDYYLQLRRNINGIIKKIASLDCFRRARHRPQIVSVGHSLGGGLAQFAALANSPSGPRIAKVFAFDPSPVTGARLVDKGTRLTNAHDLEIDRIYQSGEVLAGLRRYYEQFPASSSPCKPLVRTVVFDALQPGGAVVVHNMAGLAGQAVQLSYNDDRQLAFAVPQGTNCRTRYRPPASDEDERRAPEGGPEVAYAPNGVVLRTARAARHGLASRYARINSYGATYPARAAYGSDGSDARFSQINSYDGGHGYAAGWNGATIRVMRFKPQKGARAAGAHKGKRLQLANS
jgi:hypothetical protein